MNLTYHLYLLITLITAAPRFIRGSLLGEQLTARAMVVEELSFSSSFTVSMWFKFGDGQDLCIDVRFRHNNDGGHVEVGAGSSGQTSLVVIKECSWHHVALSINPTTGKMQLYENGKQSTLPDRNWECKTTKGRLSLGGAVVCRTDGHCYVGATQASKGYIADVAIYSPAWDPNNIPLVPPSMDMPYPFELKAYWPLKVTADANLSTPLKDETGTYTLLGSWKDDTDKMFYGPPKLSVLNPPATFAEGDAGPANICPRVDPSTSNSNVHFGVQCAILVACTLMLLL